MRTPRLFLMIALALSASAIVAAGSPGLARAQDDESRIDTLFTLQLEDAELPAAPVFVRLLRINMDPGSSSPLHTHPGPELWRVETGVVSVRVQGPAVLQRTGEDAGPAPVNEEFELERGDRLSFLPGTPLTFTNKGEENAAILAVVILPAGHQRPPGITYVNGQPPADAFEGIFSEILGDGLADVLPAGTSEITIDRLRIAPGDPIPGEASPVLLSMARGDLDFTIDTGRVQVSRIAEPGPQPDAELGTAFSLSRGDAAYFPNGVEEAPRPESTAEITLFRVVITAVDGDATPVSGDSAAKITVNGPIVDVTPEPDATEEATEEATQEPEATEEATAEPTEEPEDRVSETFEVDQAVYVNESDVRLRDAPTTESNIVAGLTLGQELTITGEAVSADDIIWWPVTSTVDATFTGWVAEQFLAGEPVE